MNFQHNYFGVDWLAITIKATDSQDDGIISGFLNGLEIRDSFAPTGHGARGFRTMLDGLHGAKLYLDPVNDGNYVHLVLPGQAMASIDLVNLWNELKLLDHIGVQWNITRLDLAWDTVAFSAGDFWRDVIKPGAFTCRVRRDSIHQHEQVTGQGRTVYVGSRQSLQVLRVYDKFDTEALAPGGCTRVELELHDERATWALSVMMASAPALWGVTATEILAGFMDVHIDWWRQWLDVVQDAWIRLSHPVSSVEKIEKWLFSQVLPSLATYVKAKSHVLGQGIPLELLDYLYRRGLKGMGPKHDALVKDYYTHITKRVISYT